jgi:cellulose synthase/poly-beta-1,6-N-acetylglucosamine synthase-like glycosyltransferase
LTRFSEFQSIILPVHNAEQWLDECLQSVLQQDFEGTMELSIFNDASKVFMDLLLGGLAVLQVAFEESFLTCNIAFPGQVYDYH